MKENGQNCSYQRNAFGVRKLAYALIQKDLAAGIGKSPRQSGSKLPHSKVNFATETYWDGTYCLSVLSGPSEAPAVIFDKLRIP